jgi:hypothetical protein
MQRILLYQKCWKDPVSSFRRLNYGRRVEGVKRRVSVIGLNACTEEELEQALAGLLVHARKELLTDTEVQEFWQVHQEIQRRRGTAA